MSASNGRRRVVVTGIGGVTSLGNTIEETWAGLIAGRSGAGPITQFRKSESHSIRRSPVTWPMSSYRTFASTGYIISSRPRAMGSEV